MELILSMYNVHSYFSLKNLGKKVHVIHGKIRYINSGWTFSRHTSYACFNVQYKGKLPFPWVMLLIISCGTGWCGLVD